MTVTDIQIAPFGHRPATAPVTGTSPEPEITMINDLEILSEDNRCNCNASDDNPY